MPWILIANLLRKIRSWLRLITKLCVQLIKMNFGDSLSLTQITPHTAWQRLTKPIILKPLITVCILQSFISFAIFQMFGLPQNLKRILFDILAAFPSLYSLSFLSLSVSLFLLLFLPLSLCLLSLLSLFLSLFLSLSLSFGLQFSISLNSTNGACSYCSQRQRNLLQAIEIQIFISVHYSLFLGWWKKNIVQFSLSCLLLVVIDT